MEENELSLSMVLTFKTELLFPTYAYNTYKLHTTDEQRVEYKGSVTVP